MRKILSSAVILTAAAAVSMPAYGITPQQQERRVNVLTYNIRNAIGMDGVRDYDRLADAIARTGADIVAVQEVDSVTGRSGGRYVLGEIGARALYHPCFSAAIDYDGGKYGIGLLSKEKPLSVKRLPLPGREEARTLIVAEFPGYIMANAHLSLTSDDALASVPVIVAEAVAAEKPFIVAGDWNSKPDSPVIAELKKAGFQIVSDGKTPTWPADKPTECIDYIAVYKPDSAGIVALSSSVLNEPAASDHRPIKATLQIKTPVDRMVYHKPYLQNPTDGGITVMFQTNALADCSVEYGTDTLHFKKARALEAGQAIVHDIEHKVRLTGLEPGKKYYYRVRAKEIIANHAYSKKFGDEYVSPFYTFTVPASDATDFTALIFDDLHEFKPTIQAFSKLADEIPHDLVIFNGDCFTEPSSRADAMATIHLIADAFDLANVPSLIIRGNHEIRNAYSSGMPSLLDQPGGKTYGAFNWGDTRFVFLDCGEDKTDDTWVYYGLNDFTQLRADQAEFLKAELKSNAMKKASKRVLVHHIPIWGNTDKYKPCSEMWQPLLAKAPFDVDIAGHTHEHKYYPEGTQEGNPMPVVVGGGYKPESATMMVLSRKGKAMTLSVLNTKGEEILHLDL